MIIWRQQLSFKCLADKYGQDAVIQAIHPRAKKAIRQIYLENLGQYMQWFPWSWFSEMQFIGAGGFSAVYSVKTTPTYDPQPQKMALKIVDDKLLNEVRKKKGIHINHVSFLRLIHMFIDICTIQSLFTSLISRFDCL